MKSRKNIYIWGLGLIIFFLSGFKFFEKTKYIWRDGEFSYVKLENVDKSISGIKHPYEISPEVLEKILLSIYYERVWLNIPFSRGKAKQYQLFLPEEAKTLASHLSEGFKKANSRQWLNFSLECKRGKILVGSVRITDGIAFIKDGELNLVFRNIAEKLGVDENINTSNPLKYYPNSSRLVAKEGQRLAKNKKGKPRDNWLIIELNYFQKKASAKEKEIEKQKPPSTQKEKSIKERLLKLRELYEEGLITEEEYKKKRQEILDEL